jgi:hypothetical protein
MIIIVSLVRTKHHNDLRHNKRSTIDYKGRDSKARGATIKLKRTNGIVVATIVIQGVDVHQKSEAGFASLSSLQYC